MNFLLSIRKVYKTFNLVVKYLPTLIKEVSEVVGPVREFIEDIIEIWRVKA